MQTQSALLRPALAALVLAFAQPVAAATLTEALSAYRSNRVAHAETQLTAVAADPAASDADRAAARRELGRIDWLIRGETDAAAAALAGDAAGEERCATVLMGLRVFREAGAPETGLVAAQNQGACTSAQAQDMHVALARAHIARGDLDAAAAALAAADPVAQRDPATAAARFSLALMQRNTRAAMQGWRDYYWLDSADAPQALAMYAGRVEAVFASGLAVNAPDADRAALVDMLIRAGFYDDALRLAGAMSEAPHWQSARAYFAFRATVRDAMLRANREMATGGRATWLEDALRTALMELMSANGLSGDPIVALGEAYGLYGTLGETSGYPSMHAGHLAQNEALRVAQYGREGELRFIVIDNMISNGFESWLWDGWAEAGGWAPDESTIVQVRSAYTDGPLTALHRARPGASRDRYLVEMESTVAAERASLGRDGVAELPSTSDRLGLQAIDQIYARANGDAANFIALHWQETVNYSITLHEGRHALDKAAGRFSTPDLEFRAKLSQIALSDFPRLGLANVAGGAQNSTPHGRANRRVLEGYRSWMREHRDEIAGFDRNAPTLTQLHLLTDAQIRAAAQSVDPWVE